MSQSEIKMESTERVETVSFGMWLFLSSEVMFFTAFFAMVIIMRTSHPELIHPFPLNLWIGSINLLVFLASLFFMNRAVLAGREGNSKAAGSNLLYTASLGLLYLILKSVEYVGEIHQGKLPSTNIFYGCYYTLTGFEALHVLAGVVILAVLAWRAKRGDFTKTYFSPMEVFQLYWDLLAVVYFIIFMVFYFD
jgi:heme/copper-type cytochrome/quinol oxidase subunit 3